MFFTYLSSSFISALLPADCLLSVLLLSVRRSFILPVWYIRQIMSPLAWFAGGGHYSSTALTKPTVL